MPPSFGSPEKPDSGSTADHPKAKTSFWTDELGYLHAVVAIVGTMMVGWAIEFFLGGKGVTPPSWPVNILFLGFFCSWLILLSRFENRLIAWLAGVPFAIICLVGLIILGAIGGIFPQDPTTAPSWIRILGMDHVFRGAPFLLLILLLLTNLGLTTLQKVRQLGRKAWFFSLNHLGIWITLAAGFFGTGDITRGRTILREGQAEAMIVDGKGNHGFLPFGLLLSRFFVETYPEGPGIQRGIAKRFVAEVTVLRKSQVRETAVIEVNRPLHLDGWDLYLTNYELSDSGTTDQCLVEAVRDPWLPIVYAGIFLWLFGAVAMLFRCPFDQKGENKS